MDINRITVLGRLTDRPVLKKTNGGKPMATMRIATNRRFKDGSGEWKSSAEFHSVVAWEHQAKDISDVWDAGDIIFVEGRLQHRAWKDEQGQRRFFTEIVADHIEYFGQLRDKCQDDEKITFQQKG